VLESERGSAGAAKKLPAGGRFLKEKLFLSGARLSAPEGLVSG